MHILFLDQSGSLGGAELALLDIASAYLDRCLVGLLADGSFRELLEKHQIPVQVLTHETIQVRKDSSVLQGVQSLKALITPVQRVVTLSRQFDLIYANTQKALVVGAIASFLSHRPLVYHLHDIVSPEHFSAVNRQIIIRLTNTFASLVIANSYATQAAFITAGGRSDISTVVYNGFRPESYQHATSEVTKLRQHLGIDSQFVVGHFSRLSPWKGQHILIEALVDCPKDVVAVLVGDALFGEHEYVEQLHQQVKRLDLQDRVHFLGFRSDVPALMAACDLVAHTSIAPEPFGRVIVEAMLSGTPVVAAAAGGAIELVKHEETGWLVNPGDPIRLATLINQCRQQPELSKAMAHRARLDAVHRFDLFTTNQQIDCGIQRVIAKATMQY